MPVKLNSLLFLLLLITSVISQSCNNPPLLNVEALNGKWNLVEAKRNRTVTKTLSGTYFLFMEGKMTNNITEMEKLVPFELKGNEIVTRGDVTYHYYIHETMGDTILLKTKIQSNNFDFLLLKESKDGK